MMRTRLRTRRCRQNGMTLIELIVVLAITGIIAGAVMMMQVFNLNIFTFGNNQAIVQAKINIVFESISQKLRYSSEIEILSSSVIPEASTIPEKEGYLYLVGDGDEQVFMYRDKTGEKEIVRLDECSISFSPSVDDRSLHYEVIAEIDSQRFSTESDITALNMQVEETKVIDSRSGGTGVIIRFSWEDPDIASGNAVIIRSGQEIQRRIVSVVPIGC